MKKALSVMAILFIGFMVTGVMAETMNYFMQESITVYGEQILKIDGVYMEDEQLTDSIYLGAGETVTINHTIQYTGNLSQFNVTVTNTNGFKGLNHSLYLDSVPLDDQYVILDQNVIYNLGIEFKADYNMTGEGSSVYILEIAPSPNQA